MDILDRILAAKRIELEAEKRAVPMRRAIEMASAAHAPHPFLPALRRSGTVNVIAEVKRASPAKGSIAASADPVAIARAYADAGAAAISVLTDARFFLGAPGHLEEIRRAVGVPLLRKDFLFEEYQIYRSRALGADAVLLIARVLEPRLLTTLIGISRSLDMEALVEVHSEEDAARAVDCGASLIGVNNRDLGTMTTSLETSLRLAERLPAGAVKVSESGIESRADIDRLRSAGYDAFLVGERLMRDADPGAALRSLVDGAAA
ncbi:MAG TPA: indole-3-glycerol phosphate synthase TrpC [Candidatus Polarisedimenticolia bacterium]|jgi:indole-3-glycerol phosphate synthase|nr:indole-3-glycerol phosphate synthase TrpC [Candidatus Polarisedimenticolia bacterium]